MPWGQPTEKFAIAVKSCHRDLDAGFHDVIRSTWGAQAKALGFDLYFFMGRDPHQEATRQLRRYVNGEIVLNCGDGYDDLPVKTRRICAWFSNRFYSHVFFCDNDTFVRPKYLLNGLFTNIDYAGVFIGGRGPGCAPFPYKDDRGITHRECRTWASGGMGYILSKRAMDIVADTTPTFWAEDMFVGNTLAPFIDKKELVAVDRNFRGEGISEHWHKGAAAVPFTPEIIKLAFQHDGFNNIYKKGILVP